MRKTKPGLNSTILQAKHWIKAGDSLGLSTSLTSTSSNFPNPETFFATEAPQKQKANLNGCKKSLKEVHKSYLNALQENHKVRLDLIKVNREISTRKSFITKGFMTNRIRNQNKSLELKAATDIQTHMAQSVERVKNQRIESEIKKLISKSEYMDDRQKQKERLHAQKEMRKSRFGELNRTWNEWNKTRYGEIKIEKESKKLKAIEINCLKTHKYRQRYLSKVAREIEMIQRYAMILSDPQLPETKPLQFQKSQAMCLTAPDFSQAL